VRPGEQSPGLFVDNRTDDGVGSDADDEVVDGIIEQIMSMLE
jgi:hypothetical protein